MRKNQRDQDFLNYFRDKFREITGANYQLLKYGAYYKNVAIIQDDLDSMCRACDHFFKDKWRVENKVFDIMNFIANYNKYSILAAELKKKRERQARKIEMDRKTIELEKLERKTYVGSDYAKQKLREKGFIVL